VGVKAELGEPLPERPNQGRLEFFVDWYVTYIEHVCTHQDCFRAKCCYKSLL